MKRLLPAAIVVLLALGAVTAPVEAAARKILTEMFTSTTCAPCYAPDNFFFYQWLPNYGGADQIITIAYHVWWPAPGNDPMYLSNVSPVQTRNTYYQPSNAFAPRMFIDGFIDGGSGYTTWPGAIEGRFLDASPISIVLTGTRDANSLSMNAAIHAEQAVNSSTWRIHWVVTQGEISEPQNSGTGYVPFVHHAVQRNMYPDGNGSAIAISQGQTVNVPMTITLNGSWDAANCRIIVFVQDDATKKVQNAEIITVPDIPTAVEDAPGALPGSFTLDQNYPNPFNPTTTLSYAVSEETFVRLKIYNMLGEEVRTLVADVQAPGRHRVDWNGLDNNGNEVPSGMYLYQMTAGKFNESRKMMLLR